MDVIGAGQTVTFRVRDGLFENSENGNSDFRVEVSSPEIYVRRVSVTRESAESAELRFVDLAVDRAGCQQLGVRALRGHSAIVQHQDRVGAQHCADPLRYHHAGWAHRHVVQRHFDLERLDVAQVLRRPDGNDSGSGARWFDIEPGNCGVGEVATKKDGMQAARRLEVVDVATCAPKQMRVLDAPGRSAKHLRFHGSKSLQSES